MGQNQLLDPQTLVIFAGHRSWSAVTLAAAAASYTCNWLVTGDNNPLYPNYNPFTNQLVNPMAHLSRVLNLSKGVRAHVDALD